MTLSTESVMEGSSRRPGVDLRALVHAGYLGGVEYYEIK